MPQLISMVLDCAHETDILHVYNYSEAIPSCIHGTLLRMRITVLRHRPSLPDQHSSQNLPPLRFFLHARYGRSSGHTEDARGNGEGDHLRRLPRALPRAEDPAVPPLLLHRVSTAASRASRPARALPRVPKAGRVSS